MSRCLCPTVSEEEMFSAMCVVHLFYFQHIRFCVPHSHLFGLVLKASALRAEDPGFESRLRRHFSGVESYQ